MEYISFSNSIKTSIKPVYYIYGDDEYLKQDVINTLKALIDVDTRDMNISVYTNCSDLAKPIAELYAVPFLSDKRLIILDSCAQYFVGTYLDDINKYIDNPNDSTILVFLEGDNKSIKLHSNKVEYIVCSHLDNENAETICKLIANDRNISITEKAVKTLCDFTGRDMMRISVELDKLYAYTGGDIDVKDIVELVTRDVEYALYSLSNAVADGDNNNSIKILKTLLATNQPPAQLLSLITTHYRNMLLLSISSATNDELAELHGKKKYYIERVRQSAKVYTQKNLKAIVDALQDLEYKFKIGMYQEDNSLYVAVFDCLNIKRGK